MATFDEYLRNIAKFDPDTRASVFWQRELERMRANYAGVVGEGSDESIAEFTAKYYGFRDLRLGVHSPREDPPFEAAWELRAQVHERLTAVATIAASAEKAAVEHMRALDFLTNQKSLKPYLAFIGERRIASDMSTARHWWYARRIAALLAEHQPEKRHHVLEIGAGAGNLAYFLMEMTDIVSYTIVDLPFMLLASGYTLSQRLPAWKLSFDEPASAGREETVAFVPSTRAGQIRSKFDLALNINSFMEMDRDARDGYLSMIYKRVRRGGLFAMVNRRQHLPLPDGSTWDNNPLTYPFGKDEVLHLEDDDFQTSTRAAFGFRPSLCIYRASVIR
jgi:putative sugar O-methyltransferase